MAKTGVVKFFNDAKGYGFITQVDGAEDLFVHRSGVAGGALLEGDTVQYNEMYDDHSGKKADNVTGGTGDIIMGMVSGDYPDRRQRPSTLPFSTSTIDPIVWGQGLRPWQYVSFEAAKSKAE